MAITPNNNTAGLDLNKVMEAGTKLKDAGIKGVTVQVENGIANLTSKIPQIPTDIKAATAAVQGVFDKVNPFHTEVASDPSGISSTSTKDNKVKFKYKIELMNLSNTSVLYSDVHYVSFIRTPIIKMASYSRIQMNLPFDVVKSLLLNINKNIFEIWNMKIYIVDELDNKKESVMFNKMFNIIKVSPLQDEAERQKSPSTNTVKLILINPIFRELDTSSGFNRIIENKTAFDAIKEYEDYIKKEYGPIDFNHVGTSEMMNMYSHETILTSPLLSKNINTLNMPKFIIDNYKPFHSFCTYFFDDFYLSPDSKSAITGHFLNFYNMKTNFKTVSIADYRDFALLTRRLGKEDFNDVFQKIIIPAANVDFIGPDMKIQFEKAEKIGKVATENSTSESYQSYNKTNSPGQNVSEKTPEKITKNINVMYSDNKENASERVRIARETMIKKIECFSSYQTNDCLPDWMQFGKLYDMESDMTGIFLYTPVSIINVFHRYQEKELNTYCHHSMKYNMIKLYYDK